MDTCYCSGFLNAWREFRPDVIHIHHPSSCLPVFHRFLGLDTPILLTLRDGRTGMHPAFYNRIVVFSTVQRDRLVKAGNLPPEGITVFDYSKERKFPIDRYGNDCLKLFSNLIGPNTA
jgi:hypothetical protein